MFIKIVICDDAKEDISRLEGALLAYDASFDITKYTDGETLIDDFSEDKPSVDLLFLDIYMPKINGVTVAQKVRALYPDVKIVFLSSSQDFYQQAYEVFAFNYIIKPFEKERLYSVLDRALEEVKRERRNKFHFRFKGVSYSVNCRDILYMESKNKLILLHMLDGSILQCYGKLDEITKELDDKSFLRCHQSFIVNLFHVTAMSESQFYIKEDVIGISRKYAKTAKDCYYEHLFTNMGREELT